MTQAPQPSVEIIKTIQERLTEFLKEDIENIQQGVYPATVLLPESPLKHVRRIPRILTDGLRSYYRRKKGHTAKFGRRAQSFLEDLPRYYRRNFHFQTDGYLSEHSAELYEHQVEILFAGAGDAMRRLIIPPLKKKFGLTDGSSLTFLEIGAGTGRSTLFVHRAFPKAKIIAVDLSTPYLKLAQKKLSKFDRVDFMQASGETLPYQDHFFDAVYSVFLFHELPLEVRKQVLAESRRVVKKDGLIGLVDSIQLGDVPAFDASLLNFAEEFHEPFYKNYISNPMQDLMRLVGFSKPQEKIGFFSKLVWASGQTPAPQEK